MGYKDATDDNIRTQDIEGTRYYYPSCQHCGKEIKLLNYIKGTKYSCRLCKYMTETTSKAAFNNEVKDRKYLDSISRICKMADIEEYERAINAVKKVLYREGWFGSTEEIMVAIELIKSGYRINHQVPLKRYRLDFVLRDQKVVLEIDGPFHNKKTKAKEQLRDDITIGSFGADWEVIRISTDDINKNITRLSEAIETSVARRRAFREENNGQLPDWYNDREKYSNKKRLTETAQLRVRN